MRETLTFALIALTLAGVVVASLCSPPASLPVTATGDFSMEQIR